MFRLTVMAMLKKLTFLLYLLSMFSLYSCDLMVDYQKMVQNDSGHDLIVYVYKDSLKHYRYIYGADSILVPKHSATHILTYTHIG